LQPKQISTEANVRVNLILPGVRAILAAIALTIVGAGLGSGQTTPGVTLSVSPSPSTLSEPVTLTATVTPAAATGKVTFYDGIIVLGVRPLANGVATLTTRTLAPGSRSLRAYYLGDTANGPASSVPLALTVTALAANGLELQAPPSNLGTIRYQILAMEDLDQDGNLDLLANEGNIWRGLGGGRFELANAYTVPDNILATTAVTGDFNGDGKPDMVLIWHFVYFFSGNGDGTLGAGQLLPFTFSNSTIGAENRMSAFDVNLDGRLDLVGRDALAIRIALGNGDGTFQQPILIEEAEYFAMADFNVDRKPDFVRAQFDTYVRLGNGDGTFQAPRPRITTFAPTRGIVTGDFNQDGVPDVVVAAQDSSHLGLGTLDGSLVNPRNIGTFPDGVAAGDLDGDGKLDLAVQRGTEASLLLGLGNGNFTTISHGIGRSFSRAQLADLNGDGRLDLVATESGGSAYPNVFLAGQFAGLRVRVNHTGPLVAGGSKAYEISVFNPLFTTSSAGLVTLTNILPTGFTATGVSGSGWTCALATLTCTRSDTLAPGTAYPPLTLVIGAAANLEPSIVSTSATVTFSGGSHTSQNQTAVVFPTTLTLSATPNPAPAGQAIRITATVSGGSGTVLFFEGGDFLGSAVLSGSQAQFVTKLVRTGTRKIWATFAGDAARAPAQSPNVTLQVNPVPLSSLTIKSSPATGPVPIAIAAADLNGDGHSDLVTLNSGADSVSVLIGIGDGTFHPRVDYPAGVEVNGLALGDVNGDTSPDIIVGGRVLGILVNNGNGTFAPAASVAIPFGVAEVNVGDFNRDGKLDLALGGGYPRIWMGNGDGTFRERHEPPLITSLTDIGDINGDNRDDIVGKRVSLGNGDGTFQNVSFELDFFAADVVLDDLDRDGKLDVAGVDYRGFHIALGKGNGTFFPPVLYAVTQFMQRVAVADINGDGHLDVIGNDYNQSSIRILFGAGNGTFTSAATFPVAYLPRDVVVSDFNGDGRPDVAVCSEGVSSATVLLGVLSPSVSITKTHLASFYAGQTEATYTISVSNGGPGPTVGAVSVRDTLPAGLTATAISGDGWQCGLGSLLCSRSDTVAAGASYPPITLTVNVAANAPAQVINQVSVWGGGSPVVSASDPTTIVATADPPALLFPVDLGLKVSNTPVLVWMAAPWATSYDVYFGTTNPPPLVTTVTGSSFAPGTLANGGTFYWRVVGKAGSFTATSPTRSFTVFNSGTAPVSLTPVTGTAGRQVFSFRARHITAGTSIQYAQFLFTKAGLNPANACYISHDPAGNVFYLLNDDLTQWYGLLGGTAGTVGNSQCTIHGATSGSSRSGTDLVTNIDISFRSGFAGVKNIYQFSADTQGNTSGWQGMGTWNDTGNPSAVELISWSPSSGAGASQVFTAVVRDGDGGSTIPFVQMVMNGSLSGPNGCFVHYDRASNTFFLLNNSGTAWSGLVGGTAGQVSNSQCTLKGVGSGGAVVGSDLTVTYNLDLAPAFAGSKKIFLQAVDNTNVIQPWRQMGTWTR
jgi:large repetitive protein